MTVDGRTVAVARVWSLAIGPTPAVVTELTPPSPVPDESVPVFPHLPDWGYGQALDWRYTAGSPEKPGPADIGTLVPVPLVDGQELTGLDRTVIAADAANGISIELPLGDWWSIPLGITTHLTREPDGEWGHLACRTQIAADGIGLSLGTLSDDRGAIGEVS